MTIIVSPQQAKSIRKIAHDALGSSDGTENTPEPFSPLHLVMADVGFPVLSQSGKLKGRMSYQIIFDRLLGSNVESETHEENAVVNWLFCEWNDQALDDGELMLLAIGTLSGSTEVEVSIAAHSTVQDHERVLFSKASRVGRTGKTYLKSNDLTEAELVSCISSFRSSIRNGATVFAEDLR